jgi:hypothetical protein
MVFTQYHSLTHSPLLPGLCKQFRCFIFFYKRMFKFVYRCRNSQSLAVNFIVRHSVLLSRMNSTIGPNVLRCSQRYHTSIYIKIGCNFSTNNIDRAANDVSEDDSNKITMLNELLQRRNWHLKLSSTSFNGNDIEQLIYASCTR